MTNRHAQIDFMCAWAKAEAKKDAYRAYCRINFIASHHLRSIAQLRRNRVAARIKRKEQS